MPAFKSKRMAGKKVMYSSVSTEKRRQQQQQEFRLTKMVHPRKDPSRHQTLLRKTWPW